MGTYNNLLGMLDDYYNGRVEKATSEKKPPAQQIKTPASDDNLNTGIHVVPNNENNNTDKGLADNLKDITFNNVNLNKLNLENGLTGYSKIDIFENKQIKTVDISPKLDVEGKSSTSDISNGKKWPEYIQIKDSVNEHHYTYKFAGERDGYPIYTTPLADTNGNQYVLVQKDGAYVLLQPNNTFTGFGKEDLQYKGNVNTTLATNVSPNTEIKTKKSNNITQSNNITPLTIEVVKSSIGETAKELTNPKYVLSDNSDWIIYYSEKNNNSALAVRNLTDGTYRVEQVTPIINNNGIFTRVSSLEPQVIYTATAEEMKDFGGILKAHASLTNGLSLTK